MKTSVSVWMSSLLELENTDTESLCSEVCRRFECDSYETMEFGFRNAFVFRRDTNEPELDDFFSWIVDVGVTWKIDRTMSFDRQICIDIAGRFSVYINLEYACIDKVFVWFNSLGS